MRSRVGQANFFLKSANRRSANRKSASYFGVPVRKSKIRKFLWFILRSQTRKFLRNTAQLCLKIVIKVVFVKVFYVKIWIRALYAIFVRRNSMYLRTCGSFKFANHKKIGFANRKSATFHICGRSANLTTYQIPQIFKSNYGSIYILMNICSPYY
jgi:hypothetical protein